MGPLEREFGWSRASLSTAMALCALLSALSLPVMGLLMDKLGVRRVLMIAIGLFALNVAAISLATSLALFMVLTALTGLTGAAQSPMGYVKSIAAHFDRRRGLGRGHGHADAGRGRHCRPRRPIVRRLPDGSCLRPVRRLGFLRAGDRRDLRARQRDERGRRHGRDRPGRGRRSRHDRLL